MLTLRFLNNIYNSFLQQDAPPTLSPIQEISDQLKQHPFVMKLEVRIKKLHHMMNSIYDIASSNLVLTDAESGASDYSMNYYFVDQLEKLSKRIIKLWDHDVRNSSKHTGKNKPRHRTTKPTFSLCNLWNRSMILQKSLKLHRTSVLQKYGNSKNLSNLEPKGRLCQLTRILTVSPKIQMVTFID